eukprot:4995920-Prymnesium_polylepis.2
MPQQITRREQLMEILEDPRMGMLVIFLVFIDVLAICGKVCTLHMIQTEQEDLDCVEPGDSAEPRQID